MKQLIFIIFILVYGLPVSGFGQARKLEKGALIVILQSKSKKIAALEEAIEKSPSSENLKRQLRLTREETKQTNEAIMAAFEQEYSFSKVLFTYDSFTKDMKAGKREGIYLNPSLEIDPSIRLGEQFFAILKKAKSESSAEGFAILDKNFEPFAKPFPDFIRLSTLSYLMNTIFASDIALTKLYSRMTKKLQKRMEAAALR